MKINQISVFIENTTGRLAEVTQILAKENISIRAISIADTADFGILRLVVDQPAKAMAIFKDRGFTAKETDVLAVEIPDKPGSLASIMSLFREEGINIEYLYATLEYSSNNAVIIFKIKDIEKGIKLLETKKINSPFKL